MEQPTPPPFVEENIQYYELNDKAISKGKFSFISGIIVCALSILIYILEIVGIATHETGLLYVLLFLSFVIIAFAIIGLIFGIKGVKSSYKVKSIIGLAFGAQNIITGIILLCVALFGAAESSHSYYYYY